MSRKRSQTDAAPSSQTKAKAHTKGRTKGRKAKAGATLDRRPPQGESWETTAARVAVMARLVDDVEAKRQARQVAAEHLLTVAAQIAAAQSLGVAAVERAGALVLTEASFHFVLAEAAASSAEDAYLSVGATPVAAVTGGD